MSESGQPGAATPGEHGDGTGQQDDLARSVSGWAPPAAGWSRGGEAGREPALVWRSPDPATGWGASSSRHGDLPAPLSGRPTDEPPGRVNGRPHVNGVRHAEEEPPVTRPAPVSAPPADEPRRDLDADRLAVPAPRPVPAVEQPSAEAEPGPARHSSDDPPAPRAPRWAEGNIPSSAPPAVQVPPVGTAASGFEVPPGFHAPTVERGAPEPIPSLSGGWADRRPPEPPAAEPVDERRAAPAEQPEWPGPSWNRPSWGSGWAPPWSRQDEPVGRRARDERAAEWAPEPTRPYEPVRAEPTSAYEAARVEPARPYEAARGDAEPRPAYERDADRPPWAGGAPAATPFSAPPHTVPASAPPMPREASAGVRPASSPPYPPPTSAPPASAPPYAAPASAPPASAAPYAAPASAPPASAAPYVAPASVPPYAAPASAPPASAAPYAGPVAPREAPAGAPAYSVPASAPPVAYDPTPAGSDPAFPGRSTEEPVVRPFRLRPEPEEVFATPPADPGGHPPPTTGPGPATATSGVTRFDRTPAPAPTSAPPYAARRSAPEPLPTAEPAADTRPDDRATAMLPQRVPAEPDVPVVPEPPAVEPSAETPELARIATHLRRDDEPAPLRERPEGFDVNAILDAVREVAGVRDAALRRTPAGAHSLRLDLADGADPAEVSRQVARLLQERMGLAAAPQNLPGMPATPPPPVRRRSAERGAEARPAEERAGRSAEAPPSGARERAEPESPRRRRQVAPHRGRATVEETSLAAAPAGAPTGSPATLGTSYSGGQMTTTETAPSRPLDTGGAPGPRVVIDHVQVSTFGLDATVEVRLIAGDGTAEGHSTGPAVDGYVLRLCAVAAAAAVDQLLRGAAQPSDRGRCFVEHTALVPFGNCEVATVVVLLVCDGWVEQLAGSALVAGDPRQAVVRATLAAVNRRLEALLA